MGSLAKIQSALSANADLSAAELASSIGISRQRVYQLCKSHNIKLNDARRRGGAHAWTNHFGLEGRYHSHFVGGASELSACADLLRRGVPVYRAVTFVSAADLVIDLRGELKRVEVRSAKRNSSGHLRYPMPADRSRYDILALVEPDGRVTYKPGIFEHELF